MTDNEINIPDDDMDTTEPMTLVEIAPGITREVVYEGRIYIYTIHTIEKSSISEWIRSLLRTMEEAPKDYPFLVVYDFSHTPKGGSYMAFTQYYLTSLGFTPSGNQKVEAIFEANPEFKACLATILTPTLSGRATKTALSYTPSRERIKDKIFFNLESALKWLQRIADSYEESQS